MQNLLVSIIIPTYNRTQYLKLTLDSIKNQNFKDYEVIVIDDGTPGDDNLLLCEKYEKVAYVKIPNSGGPSKPRNIGISKAVGKYIAFVDDDDIWLPNKLEKQVQILEQNPEFGLVHGCCEVINNEGILQGKIVGRPGKPEVKHGDVKMRMIGNWTVMMPTSFVRKEVVDKVGYFNEEMPAAGEDVEFWTRCSFETKFYYLDNPMVYYRIHNENISSQTKEYINLPLYLKNVIDFYHKTNRLSSDDYSLLKNKLCFMQLKELNKTTFILVILNVFKISNIWFLNKNNVKIFLKRLLKH
ncbi:glycosyltransferase family 2 protein [Flavobacterium lacisediminis]|uniref:Glycosyltransferase n=1 Tax=Flavobacterium lacisediminis TaxID=2989705 RepID=A0ABT3EGY9_9FLAO|nr:glycosyltransferase [Flavobacterium lacisediminis]MCW1147843.1 glycosyltransferase [Flavobacterium lacisediminis]